MSKKNLMEEMRKKYAEQGVKSDVVEFQNDDGKTSEIAVAQPEVLSDTMIKTTSGKTLTSDTREMPAEVYNKGYEEVIFTSNHPSIMRRIFKNKIVCKPNDWAFLPHGFYIASTKSGRPCNVVLNFGDQMFKGNKLPSRPEAKKI